MVSFGQHTEVAGDGFSRVALIAGQHHRTDARLAEATDRLTDARRGRVHETDEPDEQELGQRALRRGGHGAACQRQNPQPARGHCLVGGEDRRSSGVVQYRVPARREPPVAERKDTPRRSLDVGDGGFAGAVAGRVTMESRHQHALAREGDFAHFRPLGEECVAFDASPARGEEQGDLRRIASRGRSPRPDLGPVRECCRPKRHVHRVSASLLTARVARRRDGR